MTAVNIIRHADRIIMLTDGAGLSPDSTLGAIAPKMFAMPHLNAVMAVRGVKAMHQVLADYVAWQATSYDQLAANMPGKLRDWWRPQKATWEAAVGPGSGDFELFVAGWSETRGPHSFALATSGLNSECGFRPWEPVDLGNCCIAPGDDAMRERHERRLLQAYDGMAAFDLLNDQRRGRSDVGGFLQETVVTRETITTSVIAFWLGDKIGRRIECGARDEAA